MTARRVAIGISGVVGLLTVYLLVRAVDLARTGSVAGYLLGLGVLLLAGVGGFLVAAEVAFGAGAERLGRQLATEGALPVDDLPRRPSGRVEREAADARFEIYKAEVEADPTDWRAWYRLGVTYGDAGDTSRGRRAVRKAIALEKASRLV